MIAQINPNYIKTRPMKALTRLMSYALFEGRPVTTKGALDQSTRFFYSKSCRYE